MTTLLKNILASFAPMAKKHMAWLLALVLSTSLVVAQKGKNKVRAKTSMRKEVTKRPVSSHRNLVKGKQKEHSKYQGSEPTNN